MASQSALKAMLGGLNEAQHHAVTSPAEVLQVLAPPGSGKTKTLTSRVAWLLSHNKFKPWDIIVATFTVKAAREMKERIGKLIGNGLESKLVLGTFHSICFRYLCRYGHLIDIKKGFGVADSKDSQNIIKKILKQPGRRLMIDPFVARNRISSAKAKGKSVDDLAQELSTSKTFRAQDIVTVYREYEEALARSNLLDYDDLLVRCVELLQRHPACVSNVESVLVDEFQDTNTIQYELMNLFAAYKQRMTIVGDPDQSIYSFRSAEIKNLERMTEKYQDTQVINLENNYRSSGAILLAAVEVIQQDTARANRPVLATHAVGTRPAMKRLSSAGDEAAWIVTELKRVRALSNSMIRLNDVAILIRSAFLSRLIEAELAKSGLPYRMVGGLRFFDRVEIKLILDYLHVINHPDNNDALIRIINVPSRAIGEKTVKLLTEVAETHKISIWKLLCDCRDGCNKEITAKIKGAKKKTSDFVNIILNCRTQLSMLDESVTLVELIEFVIDEISLKDYLERHYVEDHESRVANVDELLQQATEFSNIAEFEDDSLPAVKGVKQEDSTASDLLSRYLANIALSSDVKLKEGAEPLDQVTISTIHGAKGLEWPVVFVPAVYDGSIPHSRAESTDEERRLLYVAMTRAKALLYLSRPKIDSRGEPTSSSQFVDDKAVKRLLDGKGPILEYGDIQCISRILGRDCPPPPNASKILEQIPSLEDDFGASKAKHAGRGKGGYDSFQSYGGLNGAMAGSDSNRYMASTAAANTGFVTATSHLQNLGPQKLNTLDGNRKRSASPSKIDGDRNRQSTKLGFGRIKTKGGLDTYLKPIASSTTGPMEVIDLTDSPQPRAQLSKDTSSHKSFPQAHTSYPPISRPPIPRDLSDHRPISVPNPKRPQTTSENPGTLAPTAYPFLSSPPTAASGASGIPEAGTAVSTVPQDPRPHPPAPPSSRGSKKTLGVRRDMDGWNSRGGRAKSTTRTRSGRHGG